MNKKNLFYLKISDGAIACSPLVNSPSLTGLIGNFDKKQDNKCVRYV